jgi:hypothetical protein
MMVACSASTIKLRIGPVISATVVRRGRPNPHIAAVKKGLTRKRAPVKRPASSIPDSPPFAVTLANDTRHRYNTGMVHSPFMDDLDNLIDLRACDGSY